jgi:hypothetical protein
MISGWLILEGGGLGGDGLLGLIREGAGLGDVAEGFGEYKKPAELEELIIEDRGEDNDEDKEDGVEVEFKVLVAANKSAKLTATGWRVTTTVWFEKSEVA